MPAKGIGTPKVHGIRGTTGRKMPSWRIYWKLAAKGFRKTTLQTLHREVPCERPYCHILHIIGQLTCGGAAFRFKGAPVVAMGFQFWVGVDVEPLFEQEAFHEDQRRPCLVAIGTLADGIVFHEQIINSGPIHDCKVRLVFIFLKPIVPPK